MPKTQSLSNSAAESIATATVSLALKYRPQTLNQVVGQSALRQTIANAIDLNQVHKAYLFYGHRGTGKTSTARILAKSLNCLEFDRPTNTLCGVCVSCRSIQDSSSLDVEEINCGDHNGVDHARELIQHAHLTPAIGRFRVFILDEAHCLTANAASALLKILEEPPRHVVFILCTTDAHKLLPTIVSRCQRFEFRRPTSNQVAAYLERICNREQIATESGALHAIAQAANCGLRDSIELLDLLRLTYPQQAITIGQVAAQVGALSESQLLPLMQALSGRSVFAVLREVRILVEQQVEPSVILTHLLQCWRDLLLIKTAHASEQWLRGLIRPDKLKAIATGWTIADLNASLNRLHQLETWLRYTAQDSRNAEVYLETALITIMQERSERAIAARKRSQPTAAQRWQQAIDTAPPKLKLLLQAAQFTQYQDNKAVLRVAPDQVARYQRHQVRIEQFLMQALGQDQLQLVIRGAKSS